MKIKTFTFFISNFKGTKNFELNPSKYNSNVTLFDEAEIDQTINNFIKDKNVVDIKISTEVLYRHNNGGVDTLQRTYTIMYKAS